MSISQLFPLTCLQVINKVVHTILIQASDSSKMVTDKHCVSFFSGVQWIKQDSHLCGMGQHCGLKGRDKGKVLSSIVTSSD